MSLEKYRAPTHEAKRPPAPVVVTVPNAELPGPEPPPKALAPNTAGAPKLGAKSPAPPVDVEENRPPADGLLLVPKAGAPNKEPLLTVDDPVVLLTKSPPLEGPVPLKRPPPLGLEVVEELPKRPELRSVEGPNRSPGLLAVAVVDEEPNRLWI